MLAVLAACTRDEPAAVPAPDVHAPVAVVDWPLPTLRPGTHSPGLALTHDGRLLLSWVNSQRGRRHVFQFSAYDLAHQRWRGTPLTVVIGNSLNVDGLHVPQVVASRDGALWARWWQSAGAGNAPEVMFSHSRDGGANWSEPQALDETDSGAPSFWMDTDATGRERLVAVAGDTAVAVWMTDDPVPVMVIAASQDAGTTFSAPLELLQGETVRPFALALDAQQAWLMWMQSDEEGQQSLWLSRRSVDVQQEYERREITRLPRASVTPADSPHPPRDPGLPRFALHQGTGNLVWTQADGEHSSLRGVKLLSSM